MNCRALEEREKALGNEDPDTLAGVDGIGSLGIVRLVIDFCMCMMHHAAPEGSHYSQGACEIRH
jgi:hypothetical protein